MNLPIMYDGIPFSPVTTLANSIGNGDTVIEVVDISAFLPGPNIATIGTDENAETIAYATISGNTLSGCIRGQEGVARNWSADTPIGRNWTNLDYKAIADNINGRIIKNEVGNATEVLFEDGENFQDKYDSGELTGKSGAAGERSETGSTITSGLSNPAAEYARVGDWFINNATWEVFEKTGELVWTSRGHTIGPRGLPGTDGEDGTDGKDAEVYEATATLGTSWTGTEPPYTQTVSVAGMTAAMNPIVDVVLSDDTPTAIAQLEAWSMVNRITTDNGSITAFCFWEKPTVAVPIQLKAVI